MTIYICYYFFIIITYCLSGIFVIGKKNKNSEVAFAYSGRKQTSEKWFMFLSTGTLICLIGLRSQSMGVDLKSYLPSFDYLNSHSWSEVLSLKTFMNFEKGYVLFNKIVGSIWRERQFFLFVCACISLIPIGRAIYCYSKMPLLSIIIYLGLTSFLAVFSALRQAIAIGILVFSYRYIRERRLIPFILSVLLACTFHKTAAAFSLAYPIYYFKMSKRTAIGSILLLPVIWVLKPYLFLLFTSIFRKGAVMDYNGAITLFLVFSAVYVFCVFFGDQEDENVNGLTNLFWMACAIQAMGGVHATVGRVGYYYMVFLVLLLPEVLDDIGETDGRQKMIMTMVVAVCFILYGLNALKHGGWAMSYPYHFFWE